MYLWSALQLFAFTTYLYLIVSVLLINFRERLNQSCAVAIFCMAVWSLQDMVLFSPQTSYEWARWCIDFCALAWIGTCPAVLWFVVLYTGHGPWQRKWWFQAATLGMSLLFCLVQWQGLLVEDLVLESYGWGNRWAPTIWVPLFIIYYTAIMVWALVLLVRYQIQVRAQNLKKLARMMLISIFLCFLFASILDLYFPLLGITGIPHAGTLVTLIWAAVLTYAMVKYKFMTISPAMAADNILDTMSDLLMLCDSNGRIVTVNRAAADILGAPQKKLTGQLLTQYVQNSDTQPVRGFHKNFGKKAFENIQLKLKTGTGSWLPVMLSSSVMIDDRNEVAGTVTVAKDMHTLEQVQQSLRASEGRYRDLVENINDVIFTIDLDGVLTYVSPRIMALSGYAPEELIGRHVQSVMRGKERARITKHIQAAVKERYGAANYQVNKKDGTLAWVRVSARPIYQGEQMVGMRGVLSDISPLMQAMEEKIELEARLGRAQQLEAIGTLAGGVAHDLNNILSGIVSYPELLLMKLPPNSDLRRPMQIIRDSGIKAATIVKDLLTLARRGAAKYEVLDLNTVVEGYLDSPEYQKQASFFPAANVTVALAPDLRHMKGSSVHLTKSVMNLMSNALEALEKQGRIHISTGNQIIAPEVAENHQVPAGEYLRLRVEDNGMGIKASDLPHIFEPFYTKKVMGRSGTGLGMAVVRETVHDHRGFIDVHSEPGRGTRFDLYFPVCHQAPSPKAAPVPLSAYQGNGRRILIVDDVAEQRTIASEMLSELGYETHTAASGKEAVAMVQKKAVDLILLDMIMEPGIDGLETLTQILAIYPDQKAIIVSGYSETDRAGKALALGALDHVKKPYTFETIGLAVHRALEKGERKSRPLNPQDSGS